MQRILSFLLLLFLPSGALADGMVVPTIAYPAKITIPDQRALICFSNGIERLVIETRFTGAGTNFAWVVPLPSQPVIEEATTGLFPTLQYLFRPEIVHEVPRYYIGILLALGFVYLLWRAAKSVWHAFETALVLFPILILAALLLPALASAKRAGMSSETTSQAVSILDRKLVGVFETTTITSREPKALENWLRENGFAVSTNAEPIIASYIKDGWVFVATKIRRDDAKPDTSTPHPLSFTFKTDKPVYPMRLTGLNSRSLTVALYVFSNARATAPHFKVESCTQPHIAHPLLRQWAGDWVVVTKLTAILSPAEMRNDVRLGQTPFFFEQKKRLFSQQGALTTALNWGAGFFAIGLLMACLSAFVNKTHRTELPRRIGISALASIALVGLVYLSLPKIKVKLVKFPGYDWREKQLAVNIALGDFNWHTVAEARAHLQEILSNPTNAMDYGLRNRDNYFVGGQFREEDSPGNYLLRETNNQLELVVFNPDGGAEVSGTWNLQTQH